MRNRWRWYKFRLGMWLLRDYLVGKDATHVKASVGLTDWDGWDVEATAIRRVAS